MMDETTRATEVPPQPAYGCVELFSGAGGLALGIERAGFHHLLLAENDPDARATITLNNQKKIYCQPWQLHEEPDARKVDFTGYKGKAHLVAGGPPCQPFSIGGAHKGYLDARDLFPTAVRAVREIEPVAFIFENVKGLARPAFRTYVDYIKLALSNPHLELHEGEKWTDHRKRLRAIAKKADAPEYTVKFVPIMCANFGAPQIRSRVFFIGIKTADASDWVCPQPTHSKAALLRAQYITGEYWTRHGLRKPDTPGDLADVVSRLEKQPADGLAPWQTVRDAIAALPTPIKRANRVDKKNNQHILIPGARTYAGHTGSVWDYPAKTLKAGVHGVPGGENMLAYGNGKVRYFTIREAACLQGFPTNYLFEGAWVEVMRQIGNAVPVMVAETMAKSVMALLRQHSTSDRQVV